MSRLLDIRLFLGAGTREQSFKFHDLAFPVLSSTLSTLTMPSTSRHRPRNSRFSPYASEALVPKQLPTMDVSTPCLPEELLHKIFLFCDSAALVSAARSSKQFNRIVTPILYRNICFESSRLKEDREPSGGFRSIHNFEAWLLDQKLGTGTSETPHVTPIKNPYSLNRTLIESPRIKSFIENIGETENDQPSQDTAYQHNNARRAVQVLRGFWGTQRGFDFCTFMAKNNHWDSLSSCYLRFQYPGYKRPHSGEMDDVRDLLVLKKVLSAPLLRNLTLANIGNWRHRHPGIYVIDIKKGTSSIEVLTLSGAQHDWAMDDIFGAPKSLKKAKVEFVQDNEFSRAPCPWCYACGACIACLCPQRPSLREIDISWEGVQSQQYDVKGLRKRWPQLGKLSMPSPAASNCHHSGEIFGAFF